MLGGAPGELLTPQVIDTVPMDETTEEMFGYFEPLYEVIHDMPRPPEAFFKRKRGEWEPLCPACAQRVPHLCATLLSPGTSLFPACFRAGVAITAGLCSSPGHIVLSPLRGGQDGRTTSHLTPLPSPSCCQAACLGTPKQVSLRVTQVSFQLGLSLRKTLRRGLEVWLPSAPWPRSLEPGIGFRGVLGQAGCAFSWCWPTSG